MVFALLLVGSAACTPISATSRGSLALPEMSGENGKLEEAFQSHVEFAREGAIGGHGAQGGGCGCG
jgi:hypothetical protein